MFSSGCIPVTTLCRVYAILNVFLGLFSLYYWEYLNSLVHKVMSKTRWDIALYSDINMSKTIADNCGSQYLEKITPYEFGMLYTKSIRFFEIACVIYSVKGVFQFFVTCFDPVLARTVGVIIFAVDIFTTLLVLYGLYLFRDEKLCLLEYSDVLYYHGQQSQITLLILISLSILKPPELFLLFCFLCNQNFLISSGETRSKGVRRSDAFRTPMHSRANSFLGGPPPPGMSDYQNLSSDEDDDEDDDDVVGFKLVGMHGKMKFVEVDLNENDENQRRRRGGDDDVLCQGQKAGDTEAHHSRS